MYTVLVVDTSGSMADYTTDDVISVDAVKKAAHCLVWLVREYSKQQAKESDPDSDSVALVSFSDGATVLCPFTSDFDAVDSAIDKLVPQNFTNMGAGLEKANELLEKAPEESEKKILLVVDGKSNKGYQDEQILSEVVGQTNRIGASIYTVGFNANSDALDEGFLDSLATTTGGKYFHASDAWWLTNTLINLRMITLGGGTLNWSGVLGPMEEKDAGTAEIPPGTGEIHSVLNRHGSLLGLGIVDPRGNSVDSSYANTSVYSENNREYVVINKPQSGNWKYKVTSAEVPEGQTSYFLSMVSRPEKPVVKTGSAGTIVLYVITGVLLLLLVVVAVFSIRKRSRKGEFAVSGEQSKACVVCKRRLLDEWVRCPFCGCASQVAESQSGTRTDAGDERLVARIPSDVPGKEDTEEEFQEECHLVVVRGKGEGGHYVINMELVNIGRDKSNHIVLDDEMVSGRHARLYKAEGGFFLEDLGSTNGTFVDGKMVVTAWLVNGAKIRTGETEFELRIPEY